MSGATGNHAGAGTISVNGNVDANTFDTIGRFYWARATVKF